MGGRPQKFPVLLIIVVISVWYTNDLYRDTFAQVLKNKVGK